MASLPLCVVDFSWEGNGYSLLSVLSLKSNMNCYCFRAVILFILMPKSVNEECSLLRPVCVMLRLCLAFSDFTHDITGRETFNHNYRYVDLCITIFYDRKYSMLDLFIYIISILFIFV